MSTRVTPPRPTRRLLLAVATIAAAIAGSLTLSGSAAAVTTISQGFTTKDKVSTGAIVSLQKDASDQVNAATTSNVGTIFGVVINDGNSLLTLSNGQANQVQVASSGIVQVLVSDINGKIVQGDQITASPISGVGMKATDNIKVVGIAQGDMSSSNGRKTAYKDKDGNEQSVILSEVPVLLNVSYYFKQPEKTIIPSVIQNIANTMAGRAVKPLPIIISAAIFAVTLVVVISIIYSMVRSSIISIGRNPMSQSAIYRNLTQMSALVVAILAVAVIAIYLILTRL